MMGTMRKLPPVLALLLLAGCAAPAEPAAVATPTPPPYTPPPAQVVTYIISGYTSYGESANVTYATTTGQSQKAYELDKKLANKPVTVLRSDGFAPGAFLYVSIQAGGFGFANCEIRVDGMPVSSNSAGGTAYGIATCQGTL